MKPSRKIRNILFRFSDDPISHGECRALVAGGFATFSPRNDGRPGQDCILTDTGRAVRLQEIRLYIDRRKAANTCKP